MTRPPASATQVVVRGAGMRGCVLSECISKKRNTLLHCYLTIWLGFTLWESDLPGPSYSAMSVRTARDCSCVLREKVGKKNERSIEVSEQDSKQACAVDTLCNHSRHPLFELIREDNKAATAAVGKSNSLILVTIQSLSYGAFSKKSTHYPIRNFYNEQRILRSYHKMKIRCVWKFQGCLICRW